MPAYISHAIMGNEVYKNINSSNKSLKVDISLDELRGYSLGADLASLSKKVNEKSHDYNTQIFFLTMIDYIRNNNLTENKHIIALLYGHIAHYFLDTNIHPLVYYIESSCKKVGMVSNHRLVEGYYDSYLAKKIMDCDIMNIKADYFNQIDLNNQDVKNLLNSIYGNVYKDYSIIKEYKKVLMIFNLLEKIVKSGIFSKEFFIKVVRFKEFMEINNLSYEELTNESNDIYTNPVTGDKHNENLLQLYYKSVDMCIEAIKKVNDSLYESKSISNLEKTFNDLSYNTGVSCSLGKRMMYVRKQVVKY